MQFILGQPYSTQASPIFIISSSKYAMMVIPDYKTACPEDSSAEKPRSGRQREKGGCNCYEVQMDFQTSVKSMSTRNNKTIYYIRNMMLQKTDLFRNQTPRNSSLKNDNSQYLLALVSFQTCMIFFCRSL